MVVWAPPSEFLDTSLRSAVMNLMQALQLPSYLYSSVYTIPGCRAYVVTPFPENSNFLDVHIHARRGRKVMRQVFEVKTSLAAFGREKIYELASS